MTDAYDLTSGRIYSMMGELYAYIVGSCLPYIDLLGNNYEKDIVLLKTHPLIKFLQDRSLIVSLGVVNNNPDPNRSCQQFRVSPASRQINRTHLFPFEGVVNLDMRAPR